MALYKRHLFFVVIFVMLVLCNSIKMYAQTQPPKPFAIYTNPAQGLYFGAFFTGTSGGTVIIYPDNTRSVTGDVIQASLGYSFAAAIFEVEAPIGTRVAILNGANTTLTGSNGGSMSLHIGASLPASPFIVNVAPPSRMQINIGGILTVGNVLSNPVGSYSGSFSVTFVQE